MLVHPNLVHDLAPYDDQRNLRVVIETPRGAGYKLKFDDKLGCFNLTRIMPLGLVYPYDFGFVPQTLASDGDPIDVMVMIDAATYPGVVIPCRLLGALQIEERGARGRANHRLLAVPVKAARQDTLRDYQGLGERVLRELERFFVMATSFTSKDPQLRGWVGPHAANEMVQRSMQRYRERKAATPGGTSSVSTPASAPAAASAAVTEPAVVAAASVAGAAGSSAEQSVAGSQRAAEAAESSASGPDEPKT